MGYFAPIIFLLVAAFLLNIVLSRIIGTQREQIATLKAFGYTRTELGLHYLKMTVAPVVLGVLLGVGAGLYFGRSLASMYTGFFRFPVLAFELQWPVLAWAVVISMFAALMGVAVAVRRAMQLPPAAAMQSEPPSPYRPALLERMGLKQFASPTVRMILRHLERRPMATLLTTLGLAMAVAVMVLGNHAGDSVDALLDFQFFEMQRYHVSIGFSEPTSARVLHDLRHLPGVVRVEPSRSVPTRLTSRHRTRLQEIMALPAEPELLRLIDNQGRRHELPVDGLLLSSKLAELLDVGLGDEVQVAVLEGRRPVERLVVEGLIDDMVGTPAYLRIDRLQRMMREGDTISGAFLAVEPDQLPELYRKLKEMPRVAGVVAMRTMLQSFRETLVNMILRMRAINIAFATIIACGVVYNSARIALAERSRDLASLRVLGYTRAEISYILLGELGLLTLGALPIGLALGYGLVVITTWGYETELFRIPVVIYPQTYGLTALFILGTSVVSALIVRRRLDHLDLVSVLKAKD
jgi:putative ABC transport system permease protein